MAEALGTADLEPGEPRVDPAATAVDLPGKVASEMALPGLVEPRVVPAAKATDALAMVAMVVALEALAVDAMVGTCMWARPG